MPQKILVTGGHGFLGWKISDRFSSLGHSVTCTHLGEPRKPGFDEEQVDVTVEKQVREVIEKVAPDVVVHCAALTDMDLCEEQQRRAEEVNIGGTENVAGAAEKTNAKLVLLSSAFVFSGEDNPYSREDSPDPVNQYGRTKAEAEKVVRNAGAPHAIVRPDQPYGWPRPWQHDTMVNWTLEKLESPGPVKVFDDWYNRPLHAEDLVAAVEKVSMELEGTFQLSGPDRVNRYRWARKIAEVFGYDPERIERASPPGDEFPAERPDIRLETEKTVEATGVTPRGLEKGLEDLKEVEEHERR